MPIYEYACQNCQHQFETLQKMSEDPLKDCPKCGESSLKKLVSAAAFSLKGTGWYATDFKSNQKTNSSNPSKTSEQSADTHSKEESSTKTSPETVAPQTADVSKNKES